MAVAAVAAVELAQPERAVAARQTPDRDTELALDVKSHLPVAAPPKKSPTGSEQVRTRRSGPNLESPAATISRGS